MAEVEETAEVESTTGSVNLNESLEADEEENDHPSNLTYSRSECFSNNSIN